uniref:Uncharacterized protein n=1 Tax=Cucumis melo TaxID=3656 RepID=A0A9I9EJL3_CUCME
MKEKKEKRRVPNLLHNFFLYTKHLSPNPSALFSLAQRRIDTAFHSSSLSLCLSCPFPSSSFSSLRFIKHFQSLLLPKP